VQDRKDPEGDLVRVLEARGYTGTVTMLDGNTGMPRTIINIEKAAKRMVRENQREAARFVKWRPFDWQ